MKSVSTFLLFVLLCATGTAQAQLVIFDNSHGTPYPYFDEFRVRLSAWGYTVEQRTTPLMDNGDAAVIVILPEDGYTSTSSACTAQEAAWLMDFVNTGGGLLAAVCPNDAYWVNIIELLDVFGIADANTYTEPAYYDQFAAHSLFDGVTELGDDVIYCTSLTASAPSAAVASDGTYDYIAVYEPTLRADGGAIWMTEYFMLYPDGLDDFDNLVFLQNAFTWLSSGSTATAETSWGALKALY